MTTKDRRREVLDAREQKKLDRQHATFDERVFGRAYRDDGDNLRDEEYADRDDSEIDDEDLADYRATCAAWEGP